MNASNFNFYYERHSLINLFVFNGSKDSITKFIFAANYPNYIP